jgi:hypothetical protein
MVDWAIAGSCGFMEQITLSTGPIRKVTMQSGRRDRPSTIRPRGPDPLVDKT